MKFILTTSELQNALEVVGTTVSSSKTEKSFEKFTSDQDLPYYDNVSMMKILNVTVRTLQRYRKNGKIRSMTFGGKVYYPKNFMVLPIKEPETAPDENNNIIPLNEYIRRYNTPKTRSKILDVDRLAKRLTYFPREEKTYNPNDIATLLQRTQVKRKKKHAHLKLWPKKIKLINLPPETQDIPHHKK